MAGSTLDDIPSGSHVFLDATIFIYHFTGQSKECRRLLERCESGDLAGATSTGVLAEATHRLMMIEAVSRKLVTAGNTARKLAEHPEIVRQLRVYQEQIDRIPLMGIEIRALDVDGLVRAGEVRRRVGLLTNDSLVVACAELRSIAALATADSDFAAIGTLDVFQPSDLQ